ncbi:hypothetical protein K431DRAFT_289503 [Polychaeton citri CBS 116435]|uniref:Autophagy-related protein 14 n=1 Tax=Polychaeton citri CBS 116435 TaxID=1314669 RepID=A0A9P4PWP2_9PEZI|nr:hypothetical protein K431DRAFT_289503 [Polychaeton citri CBS 116435]
MSCSLCLQPYHPGRRPTCPSCVQAVLYQPRFRQAISLLDRDRQHTYTEAVVRPGNDGVLAALPEDADWDIITAGVKAHSHAETKVQLANAEDRIKAVERTLTELRHQIDSSREYIAGVQRNHQQRKRAVDTELHRASRLAQSMLDTVQHTNRRLNTKLAKTRDRIVEARIFLCREASLLRGLKLRKRKSRDGTVKHEYWISGVPIPNLQELNNYRPEIVSAAFDHICRLIVLLCFYLSVRLPAEIVLPPDGSPSVLRERDSYRGLSADMTSLSTLPSNTSLTARPRGLSLDNSLSKVYKEDRKSFDLFVEAVSLLACDVAWLGRVQGLPRLDDFDSIYAIGRNLYDLVLGRDANALRGDRVGIFSHASTASNLSSEASRDPSKGWLMHPPSELTRLYDGLGRILLGEMGGAEWDILGKNDLEDNKEEEEAVLVGGQPIQPRSSNSVSKAGHDRRSDVSNTGQQGGRGWMKVRGRSGNEFA